MDAPDFKWSNNISVVAASCTFVFTNLVNEILLGVKVSCYAEIIYKVTLIKLALLKGPRIFFSSEM